MTRRLVAVSLAFAVALIVPADRAAAVATRPPTTSPTYAYGTTANNSSPTAACAAALVCAMTPNHEQIVATTGDLSRFYLDFVAADAGVATTEQVVVRGGADLAKVTGQDQAAIQSAATRIGRPISLVGSRATGNISMASDYDYVVTGATKEDIAILRKALPST